MATKRKVLPDLRPHVYSFPEAPDKQGRSWSPPSTEMVQELASRHGFPESFDLASELEDRWFWWRADVQSGPGYAGSVHRKFLVELARRSEALVEAVGKAGVLERGLIFDVVPPGRLDLESLARDARNLASAATVASRRVPPSTPGARGDPYTIELLCKLWRLYRQVFGPNARRLTRTGDRYSGKFFSFANHTLRLFGVRKSNQSLGKAIEKAQAAVAKRDAERPIP